MVSKQTKMILGVCTLALLIALSINAVLYPKTVSATSIDFQIQNVSQTNGSNDSIQLVVTHNNYTNYTGNITEDNVEVLSWDYKIGYLDGSKNVSPEDYIDMHVSLFKNAKNDHDRNLLKAQIDSYTNGWSEGYDAYLLKDMTTNMVNLSDINT